MAPITALMAACLVLAVFGGLASARNLPVDAVEHDYTSYQLIRVTPETAEQVATLRQLQDSITTNNSHTWVDMWKESTSTGSPVDMLIAPEAKEKILSLLGINGLGNLLQIIPIGKMMRDEGGMKPLKDEGSDGFDFNNYHSHDGMIAYMRNLSSSNAGWVEFGSVGKSYEGRDMAFVKIGRILEIFSPYKSPYKKSL